MLYSNMLYPNIMAALRAKGVTLRIHRRGDTATLYADITYHTVKSVRIQDYISDFTDAEIVRDRDNYPKLSKMFGVREVSGWVTD